MTQSRRKQKMARNKPQQRRSRETVEAVIEAAAQVFEAYGYAAGTTNRIAARAGVSIGTLYQYFPNKDALVVALLERHLADAMRRLHEWVARAVAEPRSLRDTLALFVEGMIELHGGRPRLQHILLEETQITPRLHEALHQIEQQGAKTIAGLLRGVPEVRRTSLEAASFLIIQTVETLTHRFASHPNMLLTRKKFTTEIVSMITAYLQDDS